MVTREFMCEPSSNYALSPLRHHNRYDGTTQDKDIAADDDECTIIHIIVCSFYNLYNNITRIAYQAAHPI
jgi:hypothetical protein